MDIEQFDQAAKDLLASADTVVNAAKDDISQARSILTAPSPPQDMPSRESAAELSLRHLAKRIEDLMKSHDRLYSSIGMPPQYRILFDLMNLTPLGWEELWRVLAEHADNSNRQ